MDKQAPRKGKESASARAWSDNSISKRKFLAFLSHSKRKTMGKARFTFNCQQIEIHTILGISEPLMQYIPELF